ncbi:MAG: AI-2E family transporter [Rhodothermales bacterium]
MEQRIPLWGKVALLIVVGGGVLFGLAAVSEVVTLVVIGALCAYVFDPLASRLESHGLSRTLATTVLFAGLALALGAFLFFLFPIVAAQVQSIQEGFDVEQARAFIEDLERVLEEKLAFLGIDRLNVLSAAQQFVEQHADDVLNYVPSVLSLFARLLIIPFIMFFLLKDGRRIKKGFINLVPNRYFEFTLNVLHKTNVQLGNYLRGQFLASLIVAVLSMIALRLLGVDYFVLIGLFAGLTNLIPYLGPVVGASVAVLVSFATTGTFDKALFIIAAFALIQGIDNAGVQPVVLARNVKLHPLLILITLLIAAQFFGFLGLLLAVPATAVLKVFVQETIANLRHYHLA